jgi:hypothetical protein
MVAVPLNQRMKPPSERTSSIKWTPASPKSSHGRKFRDFNRAKQLKVSPMAVVPQKDFSPISKELRGKPLVIGLGKSSEVHAALLDYYVKIDIAM